MMTLSSEHDYFPHRAQKQSRILKRKAEPTHGSAFRIPVALGGSFSLSVLSAS